MRTIVVPPDQVRVATREELEAFAGIPKVVDAKYANDLEYLLFWIMVKIETGPANGLTDTEILTAIREKITEETRLSNDKGQGHNKNAR